MSSSDERARNYHEILDPSNDSSPKARIEKPARRRSRASKKPSTTLLNANPSNFRALVQKFTGCESASTTSYGLSKGPINLNFTQYKADEGYYRQGYEIGRFDQSLLLFNTENFADTTTTAAAATGASKNISISGDRGREQFISTVDCNLRPVSPLSFDDFDVDRFSNQDMAGPEDYFGLSTGPSKSDYSGY